MTSLSDSLSITFQDIGNLKYRVILTNVETLMKPVGGFEGLWRNDRFTRRLLCITMDEGHCISRWGGFRPEYHEIGRLRYMLPRHVRFYVASATMPSIVMREVMDILHIQTKDAFIMHRSNDRPNVRLTVRELRHSANSFLDLAFLIPEVLPDGWKPPKFLIFFDNISESIRAAYFLRNRLPTEKKSLVKWFNSDMTAEYREDECEDLKDGRTWGLTTTDSFGMGLDLRDIDLVIQWRVTCDPCTMWQRFGRAGRDDTRTATAILFAESKYFDANKPAEKKRKADTQLESGKPAKAVRRTKSAPNVLVSSHPEVLEVEVAEVAEVAEGKDDEPSDAQLAELYARAPNETPSGKGKTKVDIEPAMDAFINAATRPYLQCHRKPIDLYYRNKGLGGSRVAERRVCERYLPYYIKVSDAKDCRPDLPSGCPRCVYKKPTVCCSGPDCQPEAIMDFAPANAIPRPKAALPRSRIKKYEVAQNHCSLRKDLHDFRVQSAVQKFGRPAFAMMGHALMMSDEILQRIVDCADNGKIHTVDDLSRETRWIWAREFFPSILPLIHKHFPPVTPAPLTTRTPLQTRRQDPLGPSGSSTQKPKGKRSCRACGNEGHIGASGS